MSDRDRATLMAALAETEAAIDAIFAPLGPALAAIVTKHADGKPIDATARAKILAEFDRTILPAIAGAGPDAPSAVAGAAAHAQAIGVAAAKTILRDHIAAATRDRQARAILERTAGVD